MFNKTSVLLALNEREKNCCTLRLNFCASLMFNTNRKNKKKNKSIVSSVKTKIKEIKKKQLYRLNDKKREKSVSEV